MERFDRVPDSGPEVDEKGVGDLGVEQRNSIIVGRRGKI
jgi:hypothetical protein